MGPNSFNTAKETNGPAVATPRLSVLIFSLIRLPAISFSEV